MRIRIRIRILAENAYFTYDFASFLSCGFFFFKFILKNAHFLNILVNFWVLWKNVENFHIPEFFFENFTLTIFINALDPDPHQNFRSDPDPDPDPLQNKADPKPWYKMYSHEQH